VVGPSMTANAEPPRSALPAFTETSRASGRRRW
jgi:hypothetical protein